MSTLTPNYNLKKPDSSDPFGDFRSDYNDNMDIIDANLGGGGGGGGHTIVDENGSDMPAESKLQFTGNVSVTDDNVNGATVVDVLGGGGNVYGFAIDESRKLFEGTMTNFTQTLEYTATEDAIALVDYSGSYGTNQWFLINGVIIPFQVLSSGRDSFAVPIRKGDKISARHTSDNEGCFFHLACYGIKQGTNGIFAPVIYSDNERVIGVWRDNKPLYQKTVVLTSGFSTNMTVSHGISNLERVVYVQGTLNNDIIPFTAMENNTFMGQWSSSITGMNASNFKIYIGSDLVQYVSQIAVTLRYTKTTDVAGSGNWNTDGVPTHHYSTSEQVIGTWYNGKPIYQKVLTPTVGAGYNSLAHGISDLDECIKIWGTCKYNNRAEWLSLPYVSTALNYEITLGNVTASNYVLEAGAGFTSFEDVRIVIEYTKTTD